MKIPFSVLLKKWAACSLILRIFIGLVVGAVLALVVPGWTWIGILGKLFVSALKAIAPLLVATLVISSIAGAGGGMRSRFRTVIGLYVISTLSAALVAVAGSFLFPITLQLQDVAVASAPADLSDVFPTCSPTWSPIP
jgi:Na+/serine symporter